MLAATLVVALAGGALTLSGVHPPAAAAPSELVPPLAPPDDGAGEAEDEAPPPGPSPEELAHEQALEAVERALAGVRSAEASHRTAIGTSSRADGALRVGEEAVVPALLDQLAAEVAAGEARRSLREAERDVRRTELRLVALAARAEELVVELDDARVQLEERVIRAYKTGSLGYEATLPLTLIREATSPSELATAVKHLSTLMAVGFERVQELVDELRENALVSSEAEAARDEAIEAREAAASAITATEAGLVAAEAAVSDLEEAAAGLRSSAYTAEAGFLATRSRLAGKRAALDRAEVVVEETAGALAASVADGTAADDEPADPAADDEPADPATGDDRAPALADDDETVELVIGESRHRALARARSLPPEDRRAAADWVCPVPDGRFINDWGFPRVPDRRHEGTDLFAPIGVPVLAPVDAVVAELDAVDRYDGGRDLGGISVTLEQGRDRYYLAHLDGIHPDLRAGDEVRAGTLLGWVGRSGNARGTPPHLHLGWYVDRVAVNPYVSLAVACHSERPPHPDAPPAAVEVTVGGLVPG
jgi:murein DD-endopeptidase MepM/ murein hydrolase activator NlpD